MFRTVAPVRALGRVQAAGAAEALSAYSAADWEFSTASAGLAGGSAPEARLTACHSRGADIACRAAA